MRALVFLLIALSGCTAIRRKAISIEFEKTFDDFFLPGTELSKHGDGVWAWRWLGYRSLVVDTPEGLVVVDPANEDSMRGLLAAVPGKKIAAVIYSHHHRDHAAGARPLNAPRVIAHVNTAKDLAERAFADVLPPTETFAAERMDLSFGDRVISLIRIADGHTDGMVAVHVPHARVVYSTDVAQVRRLPPLGAPGSSFCETPASLAKLQAIDYDTYLPGHGAIGTKKDVDDYAQFLRDLERELRAALVKRGMGDLHDRRSYERAKKNLARVFFDVEDALRPKYGEWAAFDSSILMTTQWAFTGVFEGE